MEAKRKRKPGGGRHPKFGKGVKTENVTVRVPFGKKAYYQRKLNDFVEREEKMRIDNQQVTE